MKITYSGIAKLEELQNESAQFNEKLEGKYKMLGYFRDGVEKGRNDFTDKEWGLILELKEEGLLV